VGGVLGASVAAPAVAEGRPVATTDRLFEVATVVRVRRRYVVARIRRTGAIHHARPMHFGRGWRLRRGDEVALERWRGDTIAVPFVGSFAG
jgi:hypothetical protein